MSRYMLIPLHVLGYLKDCRTSNIIVTVVIDRKRQQLFISPILFLAVLPHVDRSVNGGTLEVTQNQLKALGFSVSTHKQQVKLAGMHNQIRYIYEPTIGRYVVRLLGTTQQITSSLGNFRRVTGVSKNATLGSISLTDDQALELGFIIAGYKGMSINDLAESTTLYA